MNLFDHPYLVVFLGLAIIFCIDNYLPRLINHFRLRPTIEYLKACIEFDEYGSPEIPFGFSMVCDRLSRDIGSFSSLQFCQEVVLLQKRSAVQRDYYRWVQRKQNGESWVDGEVKAHKCYILAITYLINKRRSGKFWPLLVSEKN